MTKPPYIAPLVRSFFEDHLGRCQNASPHTIRSYRDGLKLLLRFAANRAKKSAVNLLVTDFTEPLVLAFLTELERTRGNAIATRNHRLTAVKRLFDYIAALDPLHLDHGHIINAIPSKRGALAPIIRYLEKEQVTALLDAVPKDRPRGRRDYALLLFLYNTGARVQEVADTRLAWLALTTPYKVELLGKGRKWRTCPLWECTVQQIKQLIEERKPAPGFEDSLFVNRFGQPLSRSGIADIIERYAAKAATATHSLRGRKITPHTFRHTTAMHLLQAGVEVNVIRSWLGHVSISTTNRYIEIDLAMKRKALETCEVGPRNSPPIQWHTNPDILTWLDTL